VATKCSGSNPAVYSDYSAIQTFTMPSQRLGEEMEASSSREINLNIYPNPVKDELTISFETGAKEFQILVVNSIGQTVIEQKQSTEEGLIQKQLNVSELPNGIFFLKVSTTEGSVCKRFIKQ